MTCSVVLERIHCFNIRTAFAQCRIQGTYPEQILDALDWRTGPRCSAMVFAAIAITFAAISLHLARPARDERNGRVFAHWRTCRRCSGEQYADQSKMKPAFVKEFEQNS